MILVIDNYDSFTYNLVDYFGKLTEKDIQVHRHDQISIAQIEDLNPDYIVISPGPKDPSQAGVSKEVVQYFYKTVPILGVCLGHQVMGEVFGGKIVQATHLMHGKTSQISHTKDPIYDGIPTPFTATRYHSLVIEKASLGPQSPLEVLATSDDDHEIMAIKHREYPVYGVQYHPESILTTEGLILLENFLKLRRR
mgnify:FL=1